MSSQNILLFIFIFILFNDNTKIHKTEHEY